MSRQGRCSWCGQNKSEIQLHHVLPKRHGGDENDRVPLCSSCHRDIEEIIKTIESERGIGWENKLSKVEYYQLLRDLQEQAESMLPSLEGELDRKHKFQGGKRSRSARKRKGWWG